MIEFTVEDFPTPPLPITSMVKEFTSYIPKETNIKFPKRKQKTFFQMLTLAKNM
jgi:hypothetical protein